MEINKLVEELNSLTVLEAIELAKLLEKRWGVSSAVRIQIFNPQTDIPFSEPEQEYFDIVLNECGLKKIEVIKVLRMLIPTLGLKELKDIVESTNYLLFKNVEKKFAVQTKEQLEKAGAKVSIL